MSVFFVSVNQGVINSCRFLKNGPLCGSLTLGVRNKDFQEMTVFGINNGDHIPPFDGKVSFLSNGGIWSPLLIPPFDGKVSFLSKKARKGKPRCFIDWSIQLVRIWRRLCCRNRIKIFCRGHMELNFTFNTGGYRKKMKGHVFCSLLLLKPEEMRGYLLN